MSISMNAKIKSTKATRSSDAATRYVQPGDEAAAAEAASADEVEPPTPVYSTVTDPVWADAGHSRIDCQVQFIHLSEPAPFTASPVDSTAHGREIFERCAAGEFGSVAEYVPSGDELAAARDRLMAAVSRDITMLAESIEFGMADKGDDKRLEALRRYRVALYQTDLSDPATVSLPSPPES